MKTFLHAGVLCLALLPCLATSAQLPSSPIQAADKNQIPAPFNAALPSIFIIGDSTASYHPDLMNEGAAAIQGWGAIFPVFFDQNKVNGKLPTDRSYGHHVDVVVHGDRAFLFYFTHQIDADLNPKLTHSEDRTVLQVAELKFAEGALTADRDVPTHVALGP